jgi:hypothetical protein
MTAGEPSGTAPSMNRPLPDLNVRRNLAGRRLATCGA